MTIIQHLSHHPADAQFDRLITKGEAAKLLSLSKRTVDRMSANNLIVKLHVGGSVRFRLSDVLEIVKRGA